MSSKRFIISIDEDEGSFEITTPDGHVDYNILVETLDMVLGTLLNDFESEQVADDIAEELTPTSDPKKLN